MLAPRKQRLLELMRMPDQTNSSEGCRLPNSIPEQAAILFGAGESECWRWCPRCGHELHNEKCKLRCPRCHYFMSCSDFD